MYNFLKIVQEQVCEDASSVQLSSALLAGAIEHVRSVCEVVYEHNMENELDEDEDVVNPLSDLITKKSKRGKDFRDKFDITQPKEASSKKLICIRVCVKLIHPWTLIY